VSGSQIRAVLASRNAHKLVELRRILAVVAPEVDLVSVSDWAEAPDPVETGATFAANALIKATAAARATGLLAIADDSGITVAALNNMPGVLSARWAGRHGADDANLRLLLGQIADVPDDRRAAAFVCAAAAVTPDGRSLVAEGRVDGRIIRESRGSGGFGYDPIFVPEGYAVTTAELPAAEKDRISHRGRAFRALAPQLSALVVS
jgi:XTP/dITP diphosphohydrolase